MYVCIICDILSSLFIKQIALITQSYVFSGKFENGCRLVIRTNKQTVLVQGSISSENDDNL